MNTETITIEDQTLEEVYEYEEIGRSFKINGHFYNFISEYETKYKYYRCLKRNSIIRCRGSITISPSRQIIKMVEHNCQCQDKILEEVQEYVKKGRSFKINGHYYGFQHESKKKNKYYVCSKSRKVKCRGSITISPNRQIIKRVEHSCQSQDQISEEVQEYEEKGRNLPSIIKYEKIGRKLTGMRKIDGHFYHFR